MTPSIVRKEISLAYEPRISISYLEKESTTHRGKALLFIHGLGSYSYNFYPLMEKLILKDYRLIAIDLPNHGYSDTMPLSQINLTTFVQVIKDIIQTLELKDILVVGHSIGAALCLYALNDWSSFSESITGFLLLCPVGIQKFSDKSLEIIKNLYQSSIFQNIDAKSTYQRYFYQYREVFDQSWRPIENIIRKDTQIYYETISALVTSVVEDYRLPDQIPCPTTIVLGKDDVLLPSRIPVVGASNLETVIKEFGFPQVNWIIINECGHLPQIEKIDQLYCIIQDYFASEENRMN